MPSTLFEWLEGLALHKGVALRDHSAQLSYSAMLQRAQTLAWDFLNRGLGPGHKLVFFAEKTVEVFPYVLACFYSGVAFCPLDKTLPAERLRGMLEDLQASAMVLDQRCATEVETKLGHEGILPKRVFMVQAQAEEGAEAACPSPSDWPKVAGSTLAYIIFTSGSTGRPKGVQISQDNLLAFLLAFGNRYGKGLCQRYLSLGPLFFDMTILDCLVPLGYGASVFLYKAPYIPQLFANIVEREGIECLSAVPSTLSRLLDPRLLPELQTRMASLKLILLGAESFTGDLVRRVFACSPNVRLLNAYGPTECSVCCFACEITAEQAQTLQSFPIGRPFSGVNHALRHADGSWLAHGTGTLFLGGAQLMQGYANRSQENAERLVWLDGERYYNTGDVITIDDEGCAWFKGRDDDEIKLNGFRIHLADIGKHVATLMPGQASLLIKTELHDEECLALAHACPNLDVDAAQAELKKALPAYMMPRVWIRFHALDCLPNGKLDRKTIQRRVLEETLVLQSETPQRQLLYVRDAS